MPRQLIPAIAAAACITALPAATPGQRPISFDSVAAIKAPPPAERIAYGADPLQFGALRLPRTAGPHPTVIFIHGGCWLSQYDIAHTAALEQALADSGYAVWSLEYRRVGNDGGGWPGTFLDVARGADHLRTIAAAHRLDLSRVVAMGHSAGGSFALWLAERARLAQTSELFVANPIRIHAVFGLAPAPDLEGLHASGVCGNVIDRLMGGSPATHGERYRDASPIRMVPGSVPRTLVIGALDRMWAPPGRAYVERARAAGDAGFRVVEAPESGHFDMIAPTTPAWAVVVTELRELFARLRR